MRFKLNEYDFDSLANKSSIPNSLQKLKVEAFNVIMLASFFIVKFNLSLYKKSPYCDLLPIKITVHQN